MSTIGTSTLTNIFQKDIDPMLRTLHISANKSPLVRMWKEGRNGGEGTTQFNNNTFYISVKYGFAANVQSQAEGATLRYGNSKDDQMSFKASYLNGAFTISLQAIKSTQNRAGALVNQLMDQSQGLLTRAQIQMARQANGDGTGLLAQVNDGSPNTKSTVAYDTVQGQALKHLVQAGDSLLIGTSGAVTGGTAFSATVNSVDSATQFTIAETTSGLADNNRIVFADSYDTVGSAYTEKMGINGLLITSGTLQGLALSTRAFLQSNVDTTSEAISETRILQYLTIANANIVDASAFIITMGSDLWYGFVSKLKGTAYVRNAEDTRVDSLFTGGAGDLKMIWLGNDSPVVFDPFCIPGQVNGIDLNNVGYKQLYPLSLVEDGANMAHRTQQKLEYEVAASEGGNFYIIDPASCFKLTTKTAS